jgi:hypothetical protein
MGSAPDLPHLRGGTASRGRMAFWATARSDGSPWVHPMEVMVRGWAHVRSDAADIAEGPGFAARRTVRNALSEGELQRRRRRALGLAP